MTPGPGASGPWDPSQSLKVGPGTPLKINNGTPGPTLKLKSGILSPLSNEFTFLRIFHLSFVFFK